MRVGTIVVGFSLVMGLTAGCSDDSESGGAEDKKAADSEGTTHSSSNDSRSRAERAADQEAADAIVLTLDDFEPGWESSPAEPDDDKDKEIEADLADCLGVDPDLMNPDNPTADSPDFSSADDAQVSASVSYTPSDEAAIAAVEIYRDEDMPSCFVEAMKTAMRDELLHPKDGEDLPTGLKIGEPTFNPVSFADLGDETIAFRITVPFSASGIDVDMYVDFVTVRIGRVGIQGTFQSAFSPFSTDDAEGLLRLMIDRVPAKA